MSVSRARQAIDALGSAFQPGPQATTKMRKNGPADHERVAIWPL